MLLVDEVDKSDPEFEAFLLEVLSDFQVSIPELGTRKAKNIPFVFLTSNDSRDISDALKRRCIHLYIDYPERELELQIVKLKSPQIKDRLAEQLVEKMVAQGLPADIVNPSTPIGPRDVKPTPTGRMIFEAAAGRMPAFVDTGLNMVHVDDVAAGHIAALTRGRTGERYILGGQNASLSEILAEVARQTGRRPPRIKIPRGAIYPLAYAAEAVAQRTGREPFVTVDGLRMSKKRMFFTAAKAERELGYKARPYAEGIRDAIAWFRQAGRL